MNNPTAPVFAPDPREAKLPVWVQEQLQSYRSTITELHDTLAGLRGEHEGSKVTLIGKHGVSQDMRARRSASMTGGSPCSFTGRNGDTSGVR